MRRLIALSVSAAALIASACGQVDNPPAAEPNKPADAPSATAAPSSLNVEKESADGVSGTFEHEGAVVAFSAATAGDGATNAQIKLGERVMTANRNRSTGQANWSGGGAVLTPEDQGVLRSLATAFQERWGPAAGGQRSGLADQRDLLLRLATLLAEAPPGVPLGDH